MNKHLFSAGHTACAGCGQALAARLVIDASGPNTIVTNNTGCLEVFSTRYPESAWEVPWIHSLFENAAAVASGVEAALIYLGKKEGINVIAQAGDGGTADIGLQALSGMWERGHDILYVCLPPETEIILGDGSIIEIGEWVDNLIRRKKEETQRLLLSFEEAVLKQTACYYKKSGEAGSLLIPVKEFAQECPPTVEIVPADGTVLSWDKTDFLPKNIVCAQRKVSDETLIKITTASGRSLSLTSEHPVLIDTLDGPKWQKAISLNKGDEVYAPRSIMLNTEKEFYIVDYLDGSIKVRLAPEIKEKINRELISRYRSLKKASGALGFKFWQFQEKARFVDLEALRKICKQVTALKWEEIRPYLTEFGVQGGIPVKIKDPKLSPDLLYLLGLISSDGYLNRKNYEVAFVNKEETLIEGFKKRYRSLFVGRKINEFKDNCGVMRLIICDPILSSLGKILQIKQDPKELIRFSEELIASFVKGFFDGDGYCGIVKTKHSLDPRLILSTIEERLAARLRLMLQRLGIACFQVDRKDRFDLVISSALDLSRFMEKISTEHPLQKKRMAQIRSLWKTRKCRGKFFSIAPKVCGRILKDICKKENVPITRLDRKRNICTLAAGTRRATKDRISRFRDTLARLIGRNDEKLFLELDAYLRDDFYLDPIQKIEIVPCKSKFVYDITVEDTHLFVPEGAFIISNCYDNEAYENTGVQRSGLTPYATNTTTTPPGTKSIGNIRFKKPMPEIAVAHGIPYVATASVGFIPDLQRKVKHAHSIKGPKYIQIHVPCPLGWRHEAALTLDIGKLAVETGLYPLIEYEFGVLIGQRKITPRPVEEYLKAQGRFKHLLNNPEEIKKIQGIADNNIKKYNLSEGTTYGTK